MSPKEEKKEEKAAPAPEPSGGGGGGLASKLPLIVGALNTLVVLGFFGTVFYTNKVYKKPRITEDDERVRLVQAHASPKPAVAAALINFEPVTINIESTPSMPRPADGTNQQIHGKLHYVTVGFSIEVRDGGRKDEVEALRPLIMDKMLSMLGRRNYNELITVQGRYVLRTQLLDVVNQLLVKDAVVKTAVATNLYFTQFIVQ
ncbi:MAG: hypothetical protein A2583_03225 [Bdellovibrionales bacterium RIFOXYD1_FULL_53_11]|nr:MAG: hypothetical protein A2583_03225 [Bdellovibrionales bacterium RIFOXYD1_FULL_53_11]